MGHRSCPGWTMKKSMFNTPFFAEARDSILSDMNILSPDGMWVFSTIDVSSEHTVVTTANIYHWWRKGWSRATSASGGNVSRDDYDVTEWLDESSVIDLPEVARNHHALDHVAKFVLSLEQIQQQHIKHLELTPDGNYQTGERAREDILEVWLLAESGGRCLFAVAVLNMFREVVIELWSPPALPMPPCKLNEAGDLLIPVDHGSNDFLDRD